MGKSVGQIDLDLNINKKQYDKQLSGITSTAKKAGTVIAAAFSVKKIVDFGKQSIELGSDLAEVQNVVDATFPQMSKQVDKFAQKAISTYGLAETMTKKFSGTFGAMAKAFGFTEKQAYDMGTTLTGLAGDVASFYNISQDEAYVKLKSVFTGETESLKDLGVVMTQTALDSYAMAKGFGKVTAKMTEAEKVALRYAFVQDQLAIAAGDFARTSDGWANQVRVLKLQFDSLKATIGQGLINVFSPVLKVINTLISRLAVLANAFKAFTEMVTGNKSSGTEAEKSLSSAAGAAEALTDSTAAAGDAAKKTAKEMKGLMGFDKIQKQDSASTDSGTSASVGGIDFDSLASGKTIIDKADKSCGRLLEKFKELKTICKEGFSIEFGDSKKNPKKTLKSLEGIMGSIKEIFSSNEIKKSSGNWAKVAALSIGRVAGIAAKTGTSIATNLTAGISKSLNEKKDFIKERIAGLLDISADTLELRTNYAAAIGDIISGALTSASGIDISADICSILTTGVLGGAELFARAGLDLSSCLIQPIIDNKGKISDAITNTLSPISTVVSTVKTGIEDAFANIKSAYDEHVAPTLNTFKEGISDSFGKLLDAYNEHIAPVLDVLSEKFRTVYEDHLKPCMENIGKLFGSVADAVGMLWENYLKPVVDWCIKNIIPLLAPVFEYLGNRVTGILGTIGDVFGGIAKELRGIIDFIVGVFTGDWKKAWEGVKTAFCGMFEGIGAIIKHPLNEIIRKINLLIGGLNKIQVKMPSWLGGKKFGINIPKIPELAQGGYVKPNTPQLAMIGDNRHQGEVVAPEDKLREMAMQAAKAVGSGAGVTRDELERIINSAVLRIVAALYELGFNFDGEQFAKAERIVKQGIDRRYNVAEVLG